MPAPLGSWGVPCCARSAWRGWRCAIPVSYTHLNNGLDCACDARVLNAAAERSGLLLAFEAGGDCSFRPRQPCVDGAIGVLLAEVHRSMLDRSWAKLKACADPTCLWAYYDRSKNGCSRWCNAGLCGNRDKVKRFRERQALANSPQVIDNLAGQ